MAVREPELLLPALPDALPLELPPELPRVTAWPLLVAPPDVRCCGASSRYAARAPLPNPIVGELDDGADGVALTAEEPAAAVPPGMERAPLSAAGAVARSTATGRSAAGLPPDSPGF